MRKIIKILFCVIFFPCLGYSKQWKQYCDSIVKITQSSQSNNDLDRALKFVKLADYDIENTKVNKDTIYAEYLYRKGFVLYRIGELQPEIFEESISIWEKSSKKNYLKIMKNYYFLAEVYNVKNDYGKAYTNYENCYLINKKHKLPKNTYFSSSIYCLSVIDYLNNINYKLAEKYASEYIEYNKEIAYLNYDFNYAYAFRWKEDSQGYENVLLEFNKNYEEGNLKNPELYFKINFLLFEYYNKQNKLKEIIKYGEKSVEIYQNSTMNDEKYITPLYSILALVYSEINDVVNRIKYENLSKK